jgi:hypothetical protein
MAVGAVAIVAAMIETRVYEAHHLFRFEFDAGIRSSTSRIGVCCIASDPDASAAEAIGLVDTDSEPAHAMNTDGLPSGSETEATVLKGVREGISQAFGADLQQNRNRQFPKKGGRIELASAQGHNVVQ